MTINVDVKCPMNSNGCRYLITIMIGYKITSIVSYYSKLFHIGNSKNHTSYTTGAMLMKQAVLHKEQLKTLFRV